MAGGISQTVSFSAVEPLKTQILQLGMRFWYASASGCEIKVYDPAV